MYRFSTSKASSTTSMANTIPNQQFRTCITAHQSVRLRRRPTPPDHFFIDVSRQVSLLFDDPRHPLFQFCRTSSSERIKLFEYPRQAFLSGTEDDHRDIITNIIRSLEMPFPLENIYWGGLYFPTEVQFSHTFHEIVSRLVCIARDQAGKDESEGHMDILIRKVKKVSFQYFKEFCYRNERQGLEPLYEWIVENQEEILQKSWCGEVLKNLAFRSLLDRKCFGLKSVKVEEEREEEDGCSICYSSLKKGCQAIRMPCSHMFHGFCIFRWIARRPTCPLCRFTLPKPDGLRIYRRLPAEERS